MSRRGATDKPSGGLAVIPDNEGRKLFAAIYRTIASELVLFKLTVRYVNKKKRLKVEYAREYAIDEKLEQLYKSPLAELAVMSQGCARREYGEMCILDFVDKYGNKLRTIEYKTQRNDIELVVVAMGTT